MNELTTKQEKQVRPFLKPIKFNDSIGHFKRHRIDNLQTLPNTFGFSDINGDNKIGCLDYDVSLNFKDKVGEGRTQIVTHVDSNGFSFKVIDNGIERREYDFNHHFKSPCISRLGGRCS